MFVKYGPNYYNTTLIHRVFIDSFGAPDFYYVVIFFSNGESTKEEFVTRKDAEDFAYRLTQAD